ncbi:5-dehydro-2-deoxygluconokinase [Quadrisphaera sp. KR29]|uniref:5-dehydro-2-deoxygluconokinase n=1 Tax=Quadrisphaera sp. KR29 TaxID=3461391 RepID=UPI004043D596
MSTSEPSSVDGAPEVLVLGRCGVDVYPLQTGVGLEDVETFGKFLGGSAANVAVAAARLGRRAALVSGVGDDPFGRFVRRSLRELGVDDSRVATDADHLTPVTFCEVFPPDRFPIWFYRRPTAPDLQLDECALDLDAVTGADLLWVTLTGLSEEPSRSAHHAALAARSAAGAAGGARRPTVLDLDHRADFWPGAGGTEAAREQAQRALAHATVAVGNREECWVATGQDDAEAAADALLELGVEVAVVKQGPAGVLGATRSERVVVPATPVDVVNGLGAGDAFGGSLVDGLLAGLPLAELLARCNAAGALVASRLECATAMPTAEEITAHVHAHAARRTQEAQRA